LRIKYSPHSLERQHVVSPCPVDNYSFVTWIDGVEIVPSWDTVRVGPN
jgi:hypothetical protein